MPTTPETRRRFQEDLTDKRHGTPNGFINLKCKCDRCLLAGRQYHSTYREIFKRVHEYGVHCPPELHGTSSGYGNYGCRCGACSQARSEQRIIWKANRDRKLAALRLARQNKATPDA